MSRRRAVFKPGDQFGKFEILSSLGRGAMGAVYKARHTFLNSEVAIKILIPPQPDFHCIDPEEPLKEAFARFKRECITLGRLRNARHPNLIHVDDADIQRFPDQFGSPISLPYVVMEYVRGSDLGKLMGAKMDPLHGLRVIADVTSALQVAHDLDIVHRDIKPSNIMVTNQQVTKLLDFGIAKILSQDDGITTKFNTAGIGTLQFMSPEQLARITPPYRFDSEIDHRTDIYAAGKVLYYLLSGDTFIPKTKSERGRSLNPVHHAGWEPTPPHQVQHLHPLYSDAYPIIEKMLHPNPDERYQTAGEASNDLYSLLDCQETSQHRFLDIRKVVYNVLDCHEIDPSILQGPFCWMTPLMYKKLTGINIVVADDAGLEEIIVPRVGHRSRYTVGRERRSDIHIQNPSVSRMHASVISESRIKDQLNFRIKDEQSTYGIYVNAKKVRERPLQDGDIIHLAPQFPLIHSSTTDLEEKMKRNRSSLIHYLPTINVSGGKEF